MARLIKTTMNPAMYHGFGKQPPFFEGWYYKVISADESHRLAIIPGIILGEQSHAFIQILDGVSGRSSYHVYPTDAFSASTDMFKIQIGTNRFTADMVDLDIDDQVGMVKGNLRFSGLTPWPVTYPSPGIMGWYAWVPRMECYHGVVSLDHGIEGKLKVNQVELDFNGGRGYIEKDWGQAFPSAWVWFQSNHFDVQGTCLTASVAIIPWLHSSFRGFIIGFWHSGELFRFATYTGAKILHLDVGEHQIDWIVSDRKRQLEMHILQAPGGRLLGPTKIEMGKRVDETLNAVVDLILTDRETGLVYEGSGRFAGLEVNGDLKRMLNM
jgi:hypothetical protein